MDLHKDDAFVGNLRTQDQSGQGIQSITLTTDEVEFILAFNLDIQCSVHISRVDILLLQIKFHTTSIQE